MAALLRVRDVFSLGRCGPVVVADLIDGAVGLGMRLGVPGHLEPLVIAAMDVVDRRKGGAADPSLRLHFRATPALVDLVTAFPEGSEVVASESAT